MTIPNSLIVNESVDNWAKRQEDSADFKCDDCLRNALAAKVREAVKIIREMLASGGVSAMGA